MFSVLLEAMTQEQGLPMCPLIGHMAHHCWPSALCVYHHVTLQPLQQLFVSFSLLASENVSQKKSWIIAMLIMHLLLYNV